MKEENIKSTNTLKMSSESNVLSSMKSTFAIYFDIDGSWRNEKHKQQWPIKRNERNNKLD